MINHQNVRDFPSIIRLQTQVGLLKGEAQNYNHESRAANPEKKSTNDKITRTVYLRMKVISEMNSTLLKSNLSNYKNEDSQLSI